MIFEIKNSNMHVVLFLVGSVLVGNNMQACRHFTR